MGSIQILVSHKCCNDDLEVDNDDEEQPQLKQKPVLKTTNKKEELINVETDSYTTTIPCFQN